MNTAFGFVAGKSVEQKTTVMAFQRKSMDL